jgi:hypothetical protein
MQNIPAIRNKKILAGPSVCCDINHQWSIDQVLQSGFMDIYRSQLAELTVQHYPNSEQLTDVARWRSPYSNFFKQIIALQPTLLLPKIFSRPI